jgi:hypothetical protein
MVYIFNFYILPIMYSSNSQEDNFDQPQMQVFSYEPVFKPEPQNEHKVGILQSKEKDLKMFKNERNNDVMNFEFKPPISVADNYRQKKFA